MLEVLQYEFMQNALLSGIIVSLIAGIIGSLIVVNRMVFLAGGIAHASYGGIGISIFFGLPIFLGASVFAVFTACIIAFITLNKKENIDTFIGLVWAVGMSIGIILVDITPGYNVDLMSYLFGSILAVSKSDLYFSISALIVISLFVLLFYKDILAVSYDSSYAKLRGVNVKLFYTLILVSSAIGIVVAIKTVGLILVIALLTIPVYMAGKYSNSLGGMMMLSGVLSSFFTILGLFVSYNFDTTSGASIVLVSAIFLVINSIFSKGKS